MQRKGVTLVEVLVAIFVMAIGLIALLVLFPLGALRMAQAIQDELCAQAAASAEGAAQSQGLRSSATPIVSGTLDPFNNPNPGVASPIIDSDRPSYAVFVDPAGKRAMGALPAGDWLQGDPNSNVRRGWVSFASLSSPTEIYRWFALTDGINFNNPTNEGYPKPIVAGTPPVIERDIRYTWAYLCQRPRSSNTGAVNCTVVVFNRRPLSPSSALS